MMRKTDKELYCILHLPTATRLDGAGDLSIDEGFWEQLYTDVALFSTPYKATLALTTYLAFVERSEIIEHYEVILYED